MIALTTNIKNRASAQLTGYDFNSMFTMPNGKSYGVMDGKLCEIGKGAGFDGQDINASVVTMRQILGYQGPKSLRYIYLGLWTAGDLKVIISADEQDVQTITVSAKKNGRQQLHVPAGRNTRGTYFSFRIENVGGCDFSLDVIQVLPSKKAKGICNY